jgi:hypothetical protein
MNHYIDANVLREQVSLPELLRRLGHQPVSKSGGELKYHSPIRNGTAVLPLPSERIPISGMISVFPVEVI